MNRRVKIHAQIFLIILTLFIEYIKLFSNNKAQMFFFLYRRCAAHICVLSAV